jgi:cystathionine beta-lyase/cystathionine gamma-synthase
MIDEKELSYILYQLGEEEKPYRAVTPPIVPSSNFAFSTIAHYREAILNEKDISIYTRGSNPTVRLLEKKLAALQGTEDALVFGSGSGAIAAAVLSKVQAGDHVICIDHVYSWTHKLFYQTLSHFGVTTTTVDGSDFSAFEKVLQPNTRLVFLESPTSQSFILQDIERITKWAKSHGLCVILDNSFGSPLNRKPAEFGVDLICHSATKFTSGHSDVVAGIVCGNKSDIRRIFEQEYMTFGAILSPENAWLLIRSLRTIPMRIQHSAESCRKVISFLKSDSRISKVIWPFDAEHPQHALAKAQFDLEIPMFSFQLNSSDAAAITRFCESLKIIQIAASWGGHESLIMPMIAFPNTVHPINQIRLYIGFESVDALIQDISQALDAMTA